MTKYPKVYESLKLIGFSPAKALEIILDAKRRVPPALMFIRIAHRSWQAARE